MKPSKRRVLLDTPLDQLLEKIEHAKASIRAKVEHPFHVVKNLFKHRQPAIAAWRRTQLNC